MDLKKEVDISLIQTKTPDVELCFIVFEEHQLKPT